MIKCYTEAVHPRRTDKTFEDHVLSQYIIPTIFSLLYILTNILILKHHLVAICQIRLIDFVHES
jgi:hypothetical protein